MADETSTGFGMFDRVSGWASHPFSPEMDATHWILLTVLIVSVAIFWTRILKNITE